MMVGTALVTGLAFVTTQATATTSATLITRLAFIAEQPGSYVRSNSFFQFDNFQFDFLHILHLLPQDTLSDSCP